MKIKSSVKELYGLEKQDEEEIIEFLERAKKLAEDASTDEKKREFAEDADEYLREYLVWLSAKEEAAKEQRDAETDSDKKKEISDLITDWNSVRLARLGLALSLLSGSDDAAYEAAVKAVNAFAEYHFDLEGEWLATE